MRRPFASSCLEYIGYLKSPILTFRGSLIPSHGQAGRGRVTCGLQTIRPGTSMGDDREVACGVESQDMSGQDGSPNQRFPGVSLSEGLPI